MKNQILITLLLLTFSLPFFSQKQSLPLNENFNSSSELPTGWTLETSTYNWAIEDWGIDGTNSISYAWDASQDKTGWFFTPGLELSNNVVYFIEFYMRAPGMNGSVEALRIKVGNNAESSSMSELIWEDASIADGVFKKYILPYTASSTGTHFFGWQAFTLANKDFITIDNISIYEAPEIDIAIKNTLLPVADLLGDAPNSNIVVKNLGNNEKSFDVNLTISQGGTSLYNETISVTNLGITIEQELNFTDYTPLEEGLYTYTYTVLLSGTDANNSNNVLIKDVAIINGCEHKLSLSTEMQAWGWLGASISLTSNGIPVLTNETIENGAGFDILFPSSEGASINIDFDNQGEWQTNCSWEVFDGENNSLISGVGTTSGSHIVQDVTGNCAPVFINSLDYNEINISPNPSKGYVNIHVNEKTKLSIIDITGKEIENIEVNENIKILISQKGIFFFKFENKNGITVKKIIIH